MEYFTGGDLYDYLQKRNFSIGEERVRQISLQLVLGLKYLHGLGIMHRDIKLENIMMSDDSDTAVPKIIDFGLAKFIGPSQKTAEPFGTVGYCAPEILQNQKYSIGCDIWSLGCLIYAMLTQCLPFEEETESDTIKATCYDKLKFDSAQWQNYSGKSIALLSKMLEKDADERATIEQIYDDPWFFKLRYSESPKKVIVVRKTRNVSVKFNLTQHF